METNLENRVKTMEQNLKNEEDFNAYSLCKLELENIYVKKIFVKTQLNLCNKCIKSL